MESTMRLIPAIAAAVCAAVLLAGCSRTEPPQPVRTYNLGEKVTVGKIIYTIFETQWMTQLHQQPVPRVPQHRFLIVRLTAANSGASDLMIPNLTIEDDQGNTYPELSNGEAVPQWIGFLRTVRPVEAAQGNIVFDAPPRHYKLRLTDEDGENPSLVDLPLTFGAETPDVPLPGAAKTR
jgi:hypothetical protein